MSAEYAARMEIMQRKREELTAQRQAIEKRMALHEATAAEFSAVALQSCKQKWKAQRNAAIAAKKRNDEFVRSLHEAQKQVHDTWSRLHSDQCGSSALLAQEKARYNRRVEQIFPAWQEQLQRQRVQKLRELEDKKRAVERRRYLAKKSFEKEQTLDDLIRKTRHEVEMAENLEQNELYERDLLRTQSTNQAMEVDQSIREVALEARSILQQQATKHFEAAPELDEDLAERLSETFSPRNTLRALREGNSSLAFEEDQRYEEEKPARQIRVEIPARMNTPTRRYYPEVNERGPKLGYSEDEYFEDDFVDEMPRQLKVPFNSSTTHEHLGSSYDKNVRINLSNRNQPAVVIHNESSWAAAANLVSTGGHTIQQTASYSEVSRMGQQNPAPPSTLGRSNIREETTSQPRDKVEVLPTLATGKLYPIPEVNEPISSISTVPNRVSIRDSNINNTHDRDSHSSGVATSSLAPVNTPPTKIAENRGASSPIAPVTVATPVDDTLRGRVDLNEPVERQEHTVAPDSLTTEAKSQKPPVISIPDPERAAVSPAEVSLQRSKDELCSKTEDEPNVKSPVDETSAFSLSVDSVSTPIQPNNTSIPAIAASEDWLETKDTSAEESDTNHHIEIVPRASLKNGPFKNNTTDDHELEQDGECKVDSFHDAIPVRGTINDMETSTSDAVEVPAEIQEPPDEKAVARVSKSLPPPISYRLDLLEPFSAASTPRNAQPAEDDMILSSMQSDDFESLASSMKPTADINSSVPTNDTLMNDNVDTVVSSVEDHTSPPEPPIPAPEEVNTASITEKLSPVDRVKALGALISRVEEGANEGDTLGGSTDTGSSYESKRELLKMAVGGRKAQIAFFGSDICFELILDISRDLGPVLFPPKAFEGIMNDQKIRKLHQSNKEKQLDLWKALSGHLKQLAQLKAIPAATLVDLFVTAFLAHDPDNQRSQRKLREFMVTVCGGGDSKTLNPHKETFSTFKPPSSHRQGQRTPSPEPAKPAEPEDRIGTPQLLQTAFLQRQSPPKPKVFGIASSSFKDRSSGSSDVLMSMSSGPMKLSQKLMRGGKMNDYSEFEEEEEVDLQNLIGTKPMFASGSSALSRSYQAAKTFPTGRLTGKSGAVEEESDEFDADF
ncbi:hypothetical protein PC121_g7294 [Phytophthora cactorum]|nr:hypothetical protein PC120_g6958 [Phytophthora cactorum]KAG3078110.1 hypothetical protein PC121_g7294 [Phytophthora cactorum]KAG4059849.1 hypothetical protein PC123_g5230 [Phytophthora cactorum]